MFLGNNHSHVDLRAGMKFYHDGSGRAFADLHGALFGMNPSTLHDETSVAVNHQHDADRVG